ncbi:hypothetical protein HDV01_005800 [Terramyces sp. JEL0728]|nr:hypothetical protein HDV01_005800 [Terramyces sp. JEL0728]
MSEELTEAQKLQLKREQRRAKILAGGESRLNKIVSSYSGSTEEIHNEKAESEPHQATADDSTEKEEKPDHQSNEKKDSAVEKETKNEPVRESEPVFSNMVARDIDLPAFGDPFESVEPVTIASAVIDTLAWIHAALFSLLSTTAFATWIIYHKNEAFSKSPEKDVWYLQMCRQLDFMASHPVHYDIGASSHIKISDYIMPAWGMFFTFEVVMFSIRLFQLKKTNTQKFTIPEIMKPAMIQFGFNPAFYEGLISSVWDYIDMYNTFCNDMYVVVFLMGTAVTIATVAQTGFQLCS